MSANKIIVDAYHAGIQFAVDGDRLKITANKEPSADLLKAIQENKAAIINEVGRAAFLWRITLENGQRLLVACTPPSTKSEVLATRPNAISAEVVEY